MAWSSTLSQFCGSGPMSPSQSWQEGTRQGLEAEPQGLDLCDWPWQVATSHASVSFLLNQEDDGAAPKVY